jgi:hypothetical protein
MAIVLLKLTGPDGDVKLGVAFDLSLKVGRGSGDSESSGEVSLTSGDPTFLVTPATVSVSIPAGSDTTVKRATVTLTGPAVGEETEVAIDGFAEETHSTSVTVAR